MCGIAGLIYSDKARPIDPVVIPDMCTVIHHRGPDEWGMWIDGAVGLGMKRLRIIDLAGGRQPMANHDGTIGMQKIKEHGGFTIAQDPTSAEVSTMPNAAIQNNVVDKVMSLPEITHCLTQLSIKGNINDK